VWVLTIALLGVLPLAGIIVGLVLLNHNASSSAVFNLSIAMKYLTNRGSVVRGNDGWLSFRGSLRTLIWSWPSELNTSRIVQIGDSLGLLGIRLVVVPVPLKEEVYPEKIGPLDPGVVSKQRSRFIGRLRKEGVDVVDLLPAFSRICTDSSLYLPGDTHWGHPGIAVAAREIAERVSLQLEHRGEGQFTLVDTFCQQRSDLIQLLGNTLTSKRPCTAVYQGRGTEMELYKNMRDSPVLILGDSFVIANKCCSGSIGAHLAARLGIATNTLFSLTGNVAGGFLLTKYLRKTTVMPRVVVWIFTDNALASEFE
jgi:hypothetical protein